MKTLINLIFALGSIFLINEITLAPVISQEISPSTLCNKFPANSRCQGISYSPTESNIKTRQHDLDRDNFCQKFPLNSHCQQEPMKVTKLNLDRSGEDNEWIRIEQRGDVVRLLHTNKVKQNLISNIINGAIDLINFSIPILFDTNLYKWEEHQVTKVTFKSDLCHQNRCIVTGKQALKLPQGTDIYQGLFTIQYQENDLRRSLDFRIPDDLESETVDTITVSIPETAE